MQKPIDISVIVATRNRAEELRVTLESLGCCASRNIKYEVVVVANGCSDGTEDTLASLTPTMPITAVYLDRAGKSAALNRGMEVSRGELLAFTDDDVVFSQDWITELYRAAHKHSEAAGFCGPINPIYPEATPLWIRRHPFTVPAFAKFAPLLTEPRACKQLPFGPNFAIRAHRSQDLWFRTDLGVSDVNGPISCEDVEFASRFQRVVGPIWFIPTAAVGHRVRADQINIAWLVERAFCLGRSLIAWRLPNGQPCHAPVWHLSWHSEFWTAFDCSLIANFILGQLYQCVLRGADSEQVASDILALLPKLLQQGKSLVVAASARQFMESEKGKHVQSIFDNDHVVVEGGVVFNKPKS